LYRAAVYSAAARGRWLQRDFDGGGRMLKREFKEMLCTKSAIYTLFFVILSQGVVSHASAQLSNTDEWLNKAFIEPLPSKVVGGKAVAESKQHIIEQLRKLSTSTYLRPGDVKNFSEGLQYLAGNYYYIDDDNVVRLVGTTSSDATGKKMEIKDGIVLRAVVNDKFKAGFKLPFLNLDIKDKELAELVVRDVATAYGDSNVDRAACRYPLAYRQRHDVKLFYITAATLTTVTKKIFSKQVQGGSGIVSVLNLGGETYRSQEFELREPVISISAISVNPVAKDDYWYCSEYVKIRQEMKMAAAPSGVTTRSVDTKAARERAMKTKQAELRQIERELNKVVDKKPSAEHRKLLVKQRGAVLAVKGIAGK
jgi:hypothetical protein